MADDPVQAPRDEKAAPVDELVAEAAGLAEQLAATLAGLEAALARVEGGRYGRCEICEAPLADELLAAEPAATRCAAHRVG